MTPQEKQAARKAARDAWIDSQTRPAPIEEEPTEPLKDEPVTQEIVTDEKPAAKKPATKSD